MPSLIERHALVFASEFDASGIESSMRRARALAGGRRSAAGDRAARGVGAHFPGTRRCRCAVGRAWRDGLDQPREPRVHAGGRPCDEALKELTIRQGLRGSGQSWGAWGQPNTRERRCRSGPARRQTSKSSDEISAISRRSGGGGGGGGNRTRVLGRRTRTSPGAAG